MPWSTLFPSDVPIGSAVLCTRSAKTLASVKSSCLTVKTLSLAVDCPPPAPPPPSPKSMPPATPVGKDNKTCTPQKQQAARVVNKQHVSSIDCLIFSVGDANHSRNTVLLCCIAALICAARLASYTLHIDRYIPTLNHSHSSVTPNPRHSYNTTQLYYDIQGVTYVGLHQQRFSVHLQIELITIYRSPRSNICHS